MSYRLVIKKNASKTKQKTPNKPYTSLNSFVVVDNNIDLVVLELFCVSWRIKQMNKSIDAFGNQGSYVGKMQVKSPSKENPCGL